MRRLIAALPKKVLLSLATILGSLLVFGLISLTIARALTEAISENARLQSEITRVNGGITQAAADHQYVAEHLAQYEALMKSDRLVPHTRRAAVLALERAARARGLTALSYSFTAAPTTSVASASVQPASGAYRLSVEEVEIKVGAPLDGPIYGFISDINEAFPGAVVVQTVSIRRPPAITATMLDALSRGENSGLVDGEIKVSWRTAQAQEAEKVK